MLRTYSMNKSHGLRIIAMEMKLLEHNIEIPAISGEGAPPSFIQKTFQPKVLRTGTSTYRSTHLVFHDICYPIYSRFHVICNLMRVASYLQSHL